MADLRALQAICTAPGPSAFPSPASLSSGNLGGSIFCRSDSKKPLGFHQGAHNAFKSYFVLITQRAIHARQCLPDQSR